VIREISEPVRAGHGDKFHVRAELLSEDGGEIDIESPWLHVRANRPERRVVLEDADSDHLGLSYPAERIGMGWRKQASDGEDQRDCGEAGVQRANGFHGAILEVCFRRTFVARRVDRRARAPRATTHRRRVSRLAVTRPRLRCDSGRSRRE
jgi:hypothetical protein